MSKLVKALCEMLEITRHHTSSYHPQTNSTVERVNSTLAQTLRAYINKEQTNWPSLLPSIMMAFRSSPCSESTQFTPFHLLFGREMNLPVDTSLIPKPTLGQNARQYFEELIDKLKISQKIASENLRIAKEKAKLRHDLKAREPPFKINDIVLLEKLKTEQGLSRKLSDKFTDPYYIVELGPNHTYGLRSCATNKLLPSLMHATRIKLYHEHENGPPLGADVRNDAFQPRDNAAKDEQNNVPEDPVQQYETRQVQEPPPPQPPLPPLRPTQSIPKDKSQSPTGNPVKGQQRGKSKTQKTKDTAASKEYYAVDKLLRTKQVNGKRHVLIKWQDGSPNTWEPEENISEYTLRNYYATHTKQGKRRKRKPYKFFTHSQN